MFHVLRFTKPRPHQSDAGFTLPEKMVVVAIIGIAAAIAVPSVLATLNRAKVKQTMAEIRSALNETQREAIRGNKICTLTLNFVEGKITGPCLVSGDRMLDTDIAIATNLTNPSLSAASNGKSTPVLISSDISPSFRVNDGEHVSQIAMATEAEANTQASKAGIVVQVIAKCKGNTEKGLGLGTCKNNDEHNAQKSSFNSSTNIPIKYGVLGNPEFAIVSANQTPTDPSGKIVIFNPNDASGTKRCIAISNTLGLTRIGTYQGDIEPTAITDLGRCTAENWKKQ